MADKDEDGPANEGMVPYQPKDVAGFFGAIGDGVLATFNPRTPEGARLLIAATLSELPGIETVIGQDITIAHIYSNPARRIEADTGEVQEWRRIVLLDEKGNGVTCGSQGVGKSLGIIAMVRGNPPWVPPVKCRVVMEKLSNGKTWLKLVPEIATIIVKPPKGK